jgi:hypothetical protein
LQPDEGRAKEMEPLPLGYKEMKSDALAMPALEKHAQKGGKVTESTMDDGSIRMTLRMCSRAPASL